MTKLFITTFTGFTTILGLAVLICSYYAYTKLDKTCGITDKQKSRSEIKEVEMYLNITMYLGATLLGLGIAYGACRGSCECDELTTNNIQIQSLLVIIIIITLFVITILLGYKASFKKCTQGKELDNYPLGLAIGLFISCILFFLIGRNKN